MNQLISLFLGMLPVTKKAISFAFMLLPFAEIDAKKSSHLYV